MDSFISFVLQAIEEHGSRAVRVFPPTSQVLISFAERIASEVVSLFFPSTFGLCSHVLFQVGEYITALLTRAREGGRDGGAMFLQATAASFKEAWRMVDAVMQAAEARPGVESGVLKTRAEDVVCDFSISIVSDLVVYSGIGIRCLRPIWTNTWMKK